MGVYIKGELPTEINGITMQEAVYLADEFLKDTPCNRMWDAVRALRDFYEDVATFGIEVKAPHGRLVDEDDIHTGIRMGKNTEYRYFIDRVNAPTVIEAEAE